MQIGELNLDNFYEEVWCISLFSRLLDFVIDSMSVMKRINP